MNATETIEYRIKAFKASSQFTPGDPMSFNIVLNEDHGLPGKFDAGDYLKKLGVEVADKNILVICPGNGGLCVEALRSGASTVVALEPRDLYDGSLSAVSDFASEVIGATFSRRSVGSKLVEKFDAILWAEGLDDVVHPKALFETVISALSSDGRLYIEVAHGHHKKLPESINSWRPSKDAFLETLKDYPLQVERELEGRDQVRTIYSLRNTGDRIEVLDGPDHQDTADIEYFKRSMKNALKIPKGYFQEDAPRHSHVDMAMGATDEDKENSEEFTKRIQEEIDKNRQDASSKIEPFVSKEFIQRNIFNLSEEEIAESQAAEKVREDRAAKRLAEKIKGLIPTEEPVVDNLDSIYEGRSSTPKSKKKKNKDDKRSG